ncbi:MarR family transcriptional regulator [Clavibacter sp. VKM Ac-2873]|uniref:MarR family transcriptional regulator n=1 Tax=Clavibacter sp. VKM Ac-2873 TaxID=2783813 RepID=UPI00188A7228|nr:MarR family transcriptional regulator [Clavibacter sp. VKM Ac-2873]MBF4619503.1 MarR family transcriptional regulator [Clavibacter sp. VKM Ac-2873]
MSIHMRMATAVATLVDRMDADTTEAWDSLTGLQVILVRVIANAGRTSRSSLATVARTSTAAAVPSVNSLIRKGMVAEIRDTSGRYLVLAPLGRAMLNEVELARSDWLMRAADAAHPPVGVEPLVHATSTIERLTIGPLETGRAGRRGR